MRQRRASIDETRARIIDSAIGLYETVGPSATSMSAIADRAGVTRATLYRHFPSDAAVAAAVIDAWREAFPDLDVAALGRIADPATRLRSTLLALYAGYRATDALTGNLARDSQTLPEAARGAVREPAARAVRAIGAPTVGVAHAVAFETWASLRDAGLDDKAIADLMAQFIALAPDKAPAQAARRRRTAAPARAARPATAASSPATSRRRAATSANPSAPDAESTTSRRRPVTAAGAATPGAAARGTSRRRTAGDAGASAATAGAAASARRRTATAGTASAPTSTIASAAPVEPKADKARGKGKDKGRKDKAGKKGKGDRKAKG